MQSSRSPSAQRPVRALPSLLLCLLATAGSLIAPLAARAVEFAEIAGRARQLAEAPFQRPTAALPKELQSLDYDQYWGIRYRTERALWRSSKLPFEVSFLPLGMYYDLPVKIHEASPEGVQEIKFDPEALDLAGLKLDPGLWRNLGFAGFRVRYAGSAAEPREEALTFLGASYFRALGKGQYYGTYGRGLALNTALSSGEEFPRFVEFWIERPAAAAKELVLYALLDSASATGAYRFVLRPGAETAMDVTARIFLRQPVAKLGLTPLSSMFLFGTHQRPGGDDYRPQVHNADGLSLYSGSGEWLWRPLVNPRRLLVTSFATTNPLGFGLMQRARSFGDYEDLEARFDLRPSVWVEPKGQWGAGRLELVQIPVPDETNSNIVAYWVPDKVPAVKEPIDLEYRMLWQREPDVRPPTSWVVQTLRGRGYTRTPDNTVQFVIDFVGAALKKLPADAKVEGVVWADANGELVQHYTYRNVVSGGWRSVLRVRRLDEARPVEMRVFLRNGATGLSETWSYVLPPA
jgi:glucans biosynthesis protein